jgi:hypothetical protein
MKQPEKTTGPAAVAARARLLDMATAEAAWKVALTTEMARLTVKELLAATRGANRRRT